jgi:hypothetical protein
MGIGYRGMGNGVSSVGYRALPPKNLPVKGAACRGSIEGCPSLLPVLGRLRHDHLWAVRDTDIFCSHNSEVIGI